MENDLKFCNPEKASRFFDGELETDEHAYMAEHLKTCPVCREKVEDFQSISERVKAYISEAYNKDNEELEEKIIEAIRKKEAPWWIRGKELLFSKKLLIPVGVAISFLLIFFMTFGNSAVRRPSAIITSLSGSGTSVVIMETPRSHQTILWFNENG